MLPFLAALTLWPAPLTLICAFFYPRTIFGKLIFLTVAFFIAELFAMEETPNRMIAIYVAIPFLLIYLMIINKCVRSLARNADADLWARAGISGAYLLWQQYTVTGKQARRYWLLATMCSIGLMLGLIAQFTFRWLEVTTATITDVARVLPNLNELDEEWVSWPSPEIKAAAGQKQWGDWRPQNGNSGKIVWWMEPKKSTKHFGKIYVLEMKDAAGEVKYVPVDLLGVSKNRRS